ncbi:MAG: clostripain-related cysteine peptidase [Clostridiales bacterium]|nr:clostripain-related cysteine peptidase [Clostridiales bacterium]
MRKRVLRIKITASVLAVSAAVSCIPAASASAAAAGCSGDIGRINTASQMYGNSNISFGYCGDDKSKGLKQTIFIFMIGSDMSQYAGYDICEMLGSGYSDRDTNVILIAGGSKSWSIDALNTNPVSVYKLTEDGFVSLNEKNNYNIFDTDDIYSLMFRYMARYRADSYSVLFWDHGGGFVNGFGKDESGENAGISTEKLAGVFADIKRDVKQDYGMDYNYDIVGFDACFMADVQTAQEFAKAGFKYFIGSEDAESFYGWSYDFLGSPVLSLGGGELCRAVIDKTAEFNDSHSVAGYTLSAIDLSKTKDIIGFLEGVSDEVISEDENKYLAARYNTKTYGNSVFGSRFDTGSHDYVDIGDYAEKLGAVGADTSGLIAAVDEAVIYNKSSEASCGISVYSYYSSSKGSLNSWCGLTGDELDTYKTLQRRTESSINGHLVSSAENTRTGVTEKNGSSYSYKMSVGEAEDICDAVFCVYKYEDDIFRCTARVYDVSINGNELSAVYDNSGAFMINDNRKYPCVLEIDGDRRRVCIAKDNGKNAYAADFKRYIVSLDSGGSMMAITAADTDALAAKDDSSINSGDRIYAVIDEYTEDNYQTFTTPDIFSVHNTEFGIERLSGKYYGRFELINHYGYVQYCSPTAEIDCGGEENDILHEKTILSEKTNCIIAGGKALKVPCSVPDMEDEGFRLTGEVQTLGSGESCLMTMQCGADFIDVTIQNFSTSSVTADKGIVTGISASHGSCGGLAAGMYLDPEGADEIYITAQSIKYIYELNESSVIPDFQNGELAINGLHNIIPHDYIVIETDKSTGEILKTTVNCVEGCAIRSGGISGHSYEYSAPSSAGHDPYSFVMSIDGSLYALPVPAKVLISDGWMLSDNAVIIPSMGSAEAVFTRGGRRFAAELVNYGAAAAYTEDCAVCGIYLDFTESSTAETVLSGEINLSDAAESIMAGRYKDVYNKANLFMNYNGRMLYTSGSEMNRDGQIEITAESAYIYKRYDGMRSMSVFDRLAGYFVY